ncbi:MAG TPA: replication-relaxation family protein [Pseudobdellovibrionaceae bacterium]|nr:replication-relaxation family protein [Pseudobdellovibrionaceae bacterium]
MKQSKNNERIVLTNRDINVLYFIFQMRFATSHQIMMSCFRKRRDGLERSSDFYIKRRLSKLVDLKLLKTDRAPKGDLKFIYSTTKLALKIIEGRGFTVLVNKSPETKIQNFDHDSHVTNCRISLEKASRAKDWVPEFQIQSLFNAFEKLPAKYIPDALFTNRLGELTAFEMEISRKAKHRYQDKIDKYVELVRSHFDDTLKFKRVLYITKSMEVHKLLTDMTKIHSDIFKVETYDSLGEKS